MKKSVSIFAIMLFGVMSAFPSNGAQMTSQIQRLLEQKEEKIKQLEECEGKKKGWMIAGISTIGVTAVGIGVNIAQASKSSKLSDEIDATKTELERQQDRLSNIESQIGIVTDDNKGGSDASTDNSQLEQSSIVDTVCFTKQMVKTEGFRCQLNSKNYTDVREYANGVCIHHVPDGACCSIYSRDGDLFWFTVDDNEPDKLRKNGADDYCLELRLY